MKQRVKKHLLNAAGQCLGQKYVIFESDDWGSIRIPNNHAKHTLLKIKAIRSTDPFSMVDCLESNLDFTELFNVLTKYKDIKGKNPVLTTNMVMTNPDFNQIRSHQFNDYFGELFPKTYEKYYPNSGTFDCLIDGIESKLIYPQFHATEHLNINKWMYKLRQGNITFLKAFDLECFAIDDLANNNNKRSNLMATYDYLTQEEFEEIKKRIVLGLQLFKEVFGFNSETSIAPCYVWNDEIEQVFLENGINGIQSSYIQQKNYFGNLKRTLRTMGKKNSIGQNYLIRNVLFEPSLNSKTNWVEKAMESIQIAFMWGKPAVIGTHRINYVGGLCKNNRENTLSQLDELLSKILKKWPDVEFLSSATLVEKYRND